MNNWMLGIMAMLNLVTGMWYFVHGQLGLGIVFTAYCIACLGFMLA